MTSTQPAVAHERDPIRAGWAALARGEWEQARASFENEAAPEAVEGLGMAAWWLGAEAATFQARERAYGLFRRRDNARGAARSRPS